MKWDDAAKVLRRRLAWLQGRNKFVPSDYDRAEIGALALAIELLDQKHQEHNAAEPKRREGEGP